MSNMFFWGYWKEYREGARLPSIENEKFDIEARYDKVKILSYLENGIAVRIIRGTIKDVLFNKGLIVPIIDYTDGVNVWSEELIHYYRNYNIFLPEKFTDFLINNLDSSPKKKKLSEEFLDNLDLTIPQLHPD